MKTEGNHRDNRGHAEMLKRYRQYLLLEKSLSPNTLEAYMDDASKLLGYLDDCGLDLTKVTLDDLHGFAAAMGDLGIAPRSQARIISGIKSLFKFLSLDGYREDDPSELLEAPKIGRHLPDVLTVDEIDSIIKQINLSLPEGHRNRAMIETMYSCGLRVSELPFTSKGTSILNKRNLIAPLIAMLISIAGYYVAEVILYGKEAAFLVSVTTNTIQGIGSATVFYIFGAAFEKAGIKRLCK